jgi:hypothetical protein
MSTEFRYVWGTSRANRRALRLGVTATPYPKPDLLP